MLPTGGGSGWTLVEWLQVIEREFLFFALFWFIVGTIDELAVDLVWFGLRLGPSKQTARLSADAGWGPLDGRIAIFIPAWQEADVIGTTVAHMLRMWQQADFVLYVGCYGNDPATVAATMAAVGHDPRLRLVIHDRHGPTTKADCLNRIYAALCSDEQRTGTRFRGVVLHDSEDMVHPLELAVIDRALGAVDFVQLPVRPEFPDGPHWVAGHYCDEFVEAHARVMVVRDALGAGLPAAGVGCGFSRDMLERIGHLRGRQGGIGPFAAECFTEDYELGLLIARLGGKSRFLRCRDAEGQLIGTRSYFPNTLVGAVRQKTRWMHGIALQGWDRLGWDSGPVNIWMAIRDRRGPLTAVVFLVAYALLMIEGVLAYARVHYGAAMPVTPPLSPLIRAGMMFSAFGFIWRMALRFVFTAREYGLREGLLALVRVPVANIITIMAGRRALLSYCRSLNGRALVWDKTEHHAHPAMARVPK
jgi:adsorption protein B